MTEAQISILSKSPKFCITQQGNYFDIKKDVKVMTKKLKIIEKFKDIDFNDESLLRNPSLLDVKTDNEWVQHIVNVLENLEPEPISTPTNVTEEERRAVRELANNRNIVIKKADKTNVFVVMDSDYYRDKLVLNDHLNTPTYERTTEDADQKMFKEQSRLLERHRACLTEKEFRYITTYDWKSSLFYVNPKISKCKEISDQIRMNNSDYLKMKPPASLKGRPIISGPVSPIKHLSQLISRILAPLVPLQESYVKDEWEFIKQLPRTLTYEAELFTCDVISLYTSIPHRLGVEAIEYWVSNYSNHIADRFDRYFIMEAISFILENNNFVFEDRTYHQLEGTGMGIDFAGNYACLCLGYLEKVKLFGLNILSHFSQEDIMLIRAAFKRYVDDGFLFWPTHLSIDIFIELLGQSDPSIRYTVEKGIVTLRKQRITFLSVRVTLHDGRVIETELFYKPTNNHHYLEYDSFHAKHVRDNIPYNFFKKIIVFTSDCQKEKSALNDMRGWLIKCNYPQNVVDKALHNARLQGPGLPPESKKDVIPFVTTNCSNYASTAIVKKANLLLENCPDAETRRVFAKKRVIHALKQPPNILRQVTSAKFSSNISSTSMKPNGIFPCSDDRCKIHKKYLIQCSEFPVANGTIWKVPSHITCNSKFVVYFLICNGCDTFSKIGKTNNLRKRTNVHSSSCKSGKTTDIFDKHVHACKKDHADPVFKLYVLLELNNYDKLRVYEDDFHKRGFDTSNRYKASAQN